MFKYFGGGASKEFEKELANKITQEATQSLANRIYGGLKNTAKDALGEGTEEIATNFGNDLLGEALDIASGSTDYGWRAQWRDYKKKNPDATMQYCCM